MPGRSILEAGGVATALQDAGYDEAMFYQRGGEYGWRKEEILDLEDVASIASASTASPLSEGMEPDDVSPAGFGLLVRHRQGGK